MLTAETRRFGGLAAHLLGDPHAQAVVLSHSILTSSAMWRGQVDLLTRRGLFVVGVDTRGHGDSVATPAPYSMSMLVNDVVTILDALDIGRAHFVGLSLGGMIGLGLGIGHADRLLSLVVCDARADSPDSFRAPWPERIQIARYQGCAALTAPTVERWFGREFIDTHPEEVRSIAEMIANTSVTGFVGSAQALMQLDYLDAVDVIDTPLTLVVGENDGALPAVMRDLHRRCAGSAFEVIPNAGHLPNVEQRNAFNAALSRHFGRLE